jgi:hypothetical protein
LAKKIAKMKMKKNQFAVMAAVVLLLSAFAGAGGMQNAFASTTLSINI